MISVRSFSDIVRTLMDYFTCFKGRVMVRLTVWVRVTNKVRVSSRVRVSVRVKITVRLRVWIRVRDKPKLTRT